MAAQAARAPHSAALEPQSWAALEAQSWQEVEVTAEHGAQGRGVAERPVPAADPALATAQRPANAAAVQLEVHLARAASGRVDRLVVQLEPAQLGKVEIRLDFGDADRVGAVVIVERPETLEALQRDAAGLERSLRDAGFRTDGNGLSFTLRRDQQERGGDHHPTAGKAASGGAMADGGAAELDAALPQPFPGGLHLLNIEA